MSERSVSRLYSLGRFLLSPVQLVKDIGDEGKLKKAVAGAISYGILNGLLIGISALQAEFRAAAFTGTIMWGLQCMLADVERMNWLNNRRERLFLESLIDLSVKRPSSSPGDLSATVELPVDVQPKKWTLN